MPALYMITISCADEQLTLLPQRALLWRRQATLFIADLHIGKDATFRTAGIALPSGALDQDLARLEALLDTTQAARLVVLGDFFHARQGRTPDAMAALRVWRERHKALELVLVRGNHDRHAGPPPAEWNIVDVGDSYTLPPFVGCHLPEEPSARGDGYRLAGHLHPMITLRERTGAQMRFPCFCFGANGAILPAFSSFTGGYTIRPKAGDRIFAISPVGVHEVK